MSDKKKSQKKKTTRVSVKKQAPNDIGSWINLHLPTFKNWSKHFRITNQLLSVLFILAPIGAVISALAWFQHTYYITPWELYRLIREGRPTLEGLDVLPGYLEMGDLPGYFEERKNTVDIIKETMEEQDFTMYDLVDLARCESTYNPSAYNRSSGATGLFQYKDMTWGTTPYCNEDIWDVEAQTLATIWMFEHNRFREWECFRAGKLKSSPPFYRDYHGCGKAVE